MFHLLSNIDQKCRQSETAAMSRSYSADSMLHHPTVGRQARYQGRTAFRQPIFQPERRYRNAVPVTAFRPIYTPAKTPLGELTALPKTP